MTTPFDWCLCVAPLVIRAEKRSAVDIEGDPLFMPRRTQLVPVAWTADHQDQRGLYDAVTEYVRECLNRRIEGFRNERAEVEVLCAAARHCEAKGPDAKAQELLDQIRSLQQEEKDYELKVLIFTEFIPTQAMLESFLSDREFAVVLLSRSLDMDEHREVQQAFASKAQVLVSTDVGGEGLNLQFCHVVINYDLPWNPMKLEQRIGRVDRVGQNHVVSALNFALEDTVELRGREVLQTRLATILTEFGVDNLADFLDSE